MRDFVAMAKNMRAILYLKGKNEDFIKFILRYNRRRSIGIADFMEMPEGKSFIVVFPPKGTKKFYTKLNEEEKIIFLSLCYIAPILTLPSHLQNFEKYEIMPIMAKNELDIREGLRHLRIAEYSMLDYRLSSEKTLKEYVEDDLRRFWRIRGKEIKVGSYCKIELPDKIKEIVDGYAIVIGINITA